MCGISGIYAGTQLSVEQTECCVNRMNAAQHHRGPDGNGKKVVSQQPLVVLGHTRLSIIDVSDRGSQPMGTHDGNYCITFNGEIYNFVELRTELRKIGHPFTSGSDTEVILRAYIEWGNACVNHLRGIFAFAVWDGPQQQLFVARDHLGVKPFYVASTTKGVVFASEVRAILETDLVSRELSLEGLGSYLSYGSVQEPLTLVRGISSVPAGHCGVIDTSGLTLKRYWALPVATIDRKKADVVEGTAELLNDAVCSQLISDVPIGCFLSGGIDSTAIAAAMSREQTETHTRSIVLKEAEYNEASFSRLVAKRLQTKHEELLLTPEIASAELPQAIDSFDQPSQDGLNTWFVSQLTRRSGLTVALSGVGGDELFVGYDRFQRHRWAERLGRGCRKFPLALRRRVSRLLGRTSRREWQRKIGSLLETADYPYFVTRQLLSSGQQDKLIRPAVQRATAQWMEKSHAALYQSVKHADPINRISALEMQTYMVSTLLRDTDQMSMSHGLEVRVPLIDHRLVEFVIETAGILKLDRSTPKPLLTGAFRDLMPDQCIFRKKRGFVLPFETWLRNDLCETVTDEFTQDDEISNAVFQENSLTSLLGEFQEKRVNSSRVWMIFVLLRWLRKHRITLSACA
ncbi:MAG: asparagine synthase (glutamine-hydrolyzing) [Fuerstiella sp.]